MRVKPRILFLAQCLPYPPQSGATARTFNVLRQLRLDFDVTLLAFSRRNHQVDETARRASRRALADLLNAVGTPVPLPCERSAIRRLWDHLRSVATRRPYTFFEYESEGFRTQLRDMVSRDGFEVVHIDSLDLYRWLRELPPTPTICTHHDIEWDLLRLRAQRTKPSILSRYLRYQADLVERLAREVCPGFSANVVVSARDAQRLRSTVSHAKIEVVPNGVDTTHFVPQRDVPVVPGRVVFVGSTNAPANRDAVEYLLRDVWPSIRHARPEATLQLIGRSSESARARYAAEPGVAVLGHLNDIRHHVAQACCVVAPLRIGGGTRVKILDAWAMGKAVVSTAIGCEGLEASDGENLLVRDDPEAFADAVLRVLDDPTIRLGLESHARRTAEQVYSWDVIGPAMRAKYWAIIDSVREPTGQARRSESRA